MVVRVNYAATGVVGKSNSCAQTSVTTRINGAEDEVREYFGIGKVFNLGLWYDKDGNEREDDLMRVTSLEILSGE